MWDQRKNTVIYISYIIYIPYLLLNHSYLAVLYSRFSCRYYCWVQSIFYECFTLLDFPVNFTWKVVSLTQNKYTELHSKLSLCCHYMNKNVTWFRCSVKLTLNLDNAGFIGITHPKHSCRFIPVVPFVCFTVNWDQNIIYV